MDNLVYISIKYELQSDHQTVVLEIRVGKTATES